MSKRYIGYVIEMNPKTRQHTFCYSDDLHSAQVFPTREKARENKRKAEGTGLETVYQVALDCNDRPVRIIRKMR